MDELRNVARGEGIMALEPDIVAPDSTIHGSCCLETKTKQGESSVLVEGLPIAYETAKIRKHKYKVGKKCEFHTPWIEAKCNTVEVGAGGVMQPIAREGDQVLEAEISGGTFVVKNCGFVSKVHQTSVSVGV